MTTGPAATRVKEAGYAVSRGGLWRLSGVLAAAFGPQPQFSSVRPGLLRLVFLAQLAIAERRSNPARTAVCCLSGASVWPKIKGGGAGVGLLVVCGGLLTASLSDTWPVLTFVVAVALLMVPMAWRSVMAGPARRELRRCRPETAGLVVVHMVASVERGAGRRLLKAVTEEADQRRWTLALEAGNEQLAAYYAGFGFEPTGPAVVMPWGERNVPMARQPRLSGGGHE